MNSEIAALKSKAGLKRRGADKNGEWYFESVRSLVLSASKSPKCLAKLNEERGEEERKSAKMPRPGQHFFYLCQIVIMPQIRGWVDYLKLSCQGY